jgi:hypothetical protein
MPLCPCDDRPLRVSSRLEIALARLNRTLLNRTREGEVRESLFAQWQSRWVDQRADIVRRLEAIDSQLDVWQPVRHDAPRFAVISDAEEGAAGSNPLVAAEI